MPTPKPFLEPWTGLPLRGVEGTPLNVYGCCSVVLDLSGEKFQWPMLVVDSLTTEGILGLDFLEANACTINTATRCLHFNQRNVSLPLHRPAIAANAVNVYLTQTIQLPARSIQEVMATPEQPLIGGEWILERNKSDRLPVITATALVKPTREGIPVRFLNPRLDPVTVYKGTQVGKLELLDESAVTPSTSCDIAMTQAVETNEETTQVLWDVVEHCGEILTTEQKEQFFHLLLSYSDVFAASDTDFGRTKETQHRIDTGDNPPVRQRVRRLPPHRRAEVQTLLQKMLNKNIIQPSNTHLLLCPVPSGLPHLI